MFRCTPPARPVQVVRDTATRPPIKRWICILEERQHYSEMHAENIKGVTGFRVLGGLGAHRSRCADAPDRSTAQVVNRWRWRWFDPKLANVDPVAAPPLRVAHHADALRPGDMFRQSTRRHYRWSISASGRLNKAATATPCQNIYGFITRDYMRVAEVHFEASCIAAHPRCGKLCAGHPRHWRADPWSAGDHFHGQAAHALLFQ